MTTSTVTWMWIGNNAQINTTPSSPATTTEANSLEGYRAVGSDQIRPVDLFGDVRVIKTADEGLTTAFSTTYNHNFFGPSRFTYKSPEDGDREVTQITGFLRVDYRLTTPDGDIDQEGVLIQMRNGDMFFRPSKDSLSEWCDIDKLSAVEILTATPLPSNTYVAKISFSPHIYNMEIICFAAGTMILTDTGERAAESLSAGDMIWTRDRGLQPLRWIGSTDLDAIDLAVRPKLRPIRIKAGALGADQPTTDLVVSRQHRILIRSAIAQRVFGAHEVLAPVCQLTDIPGIDVDHDLDQITYVHLMLDNHEVLMTNGALTESLYPGHQAVRALSPAALTEISDIFPGILNEDHAPVGARDLVRGARLRRLVARHVENGMTLVS